MTNQPEVEAKIEGLGIVMYLNAPFDEQVESFKKNNIRWLSARDLAYARIQDANATTAKKSSLCQNGSRILEGDLYFPEAEHKIVLLREALIFKHPKEATQVHREKTQVYEERKEFFADEKEAEDYAKKGNSLVLKSTDAVLWNEFKNDERTNWLFQDQAEQYGFLLKENNVLEMPFSFDSQNYIARQGKPYSNRLWFHGFDFNSYVNGSGRNLHNNGRARGVLVGAASAREKIQDFGLEYRLER